MAITTTLIGSLGGASIGSQAVSFDITSGGSGTLHDAGTLSVPSGGNYRVVIVGTASVQTTSSGSWPDLLFNGSTVVDGFGSSYLGVNAVVTGGPVTMQIRTNTFSSSGSPSFTGTAYWWPAT